MPTFTISPDQRQRQQSRFFKRLPQQGFTLIELLVVLAIGAMLVGLVPVAFGKLHEGSQYRDTVRSMVTDLRQARQWAVSHGQPAVFQLDLTTRQYGIEGQAHKLLPTTLEVKATTGSMDEPSAAPASRIVFLPEGGSTGGSIELVRASGGGVRLRVDWLFGQITQEPRTP
jgi:general secretion pathway protein H